MAASRHYPAVLWAGTSPNWSRPKREGAGGDLLPFLGRKQPTGEEFTCKGAEMWGAGGTWRATTSRAHTGDARRATQGLPCSAPAVCSWQQLHPPARQRAASPSPPAGVSGQQRGHPSAWPASMGWHISGDHHLQTHPLHPTRTTSCPLLQGKIQPRSPRHPQGQPA